MGKTSGKGKYKNPDGSAFWEYLVATSCFSMMFCIGNVLGWTSPGLAILLGPETPMTFTDSDAYYLIVMSGLGFALAPIIVMFVADKFGRKSTLLVVGTSMMMYWGLLAVAKDASVLILGRFIGGLASNLGICTAPMYLGEIASVKLRGALGTIIGTMTNTGLLIVFLGVPQMSLSTSACVCLFTATVSMISLWFIPESPYFLAMAGRIEEAEVVLEKLRGKTDVAEELDLVKRTVNREENKEADQEQDTTKKRNAFKQLISVPGNRIAFYINLLLLFEIQFGGYVIMVVYGQMIFEAMKTSIPSGICASIVAALQLVFNILTIFVVDRIGRKPLLCVSGIISGACFLVVGIYFYLMEYTGIDVTPYSGFPVGAMFVNIIAISFGLMPLQLVTQSETLDTEIKALAVCLLGMLAGVMSTISTGMYLKLAITWGFGHSLPFLGFCFITWSSTILILKMLPETKGKTFLEIQRALNA